MRAYGKGLALRRLVMSGALALLAGCAQPAATTHPTPTPAASPATVFPEAGTTMISLPQPNFRGQVSLGEALLKRRSVREYADRPLTLEEVSQLLWAAQGLTADWGGRTAPSAGALYPLELYLVAGSISGLPPGVYRYMPQEHSLFKAADGDPRASLAQATLDQAWVKEAAADIVVAAVYERTTRKYGEKGIQYVHIEAGHAAQNLLLQATAMGLGAVPVVAFYDEQVVSILGLPENTRPLYILPVGRKREGASAP
ncbi:MAG: SagB/ThcOx family dehydrogenase [Chloroflexota bacterium]